MDMKGAVDMIINISGKGMKVSPELQSRIEDKLGKFNRIFGDEAVANVKVVPEKDRKRIEVTLKIRNHYYRAETHAEDAFTALDQTVEVLEGQIRKYKTRIEKKINDYAKQKEQLKTAPLPVEEEPFEGRIMRRKTFDLIPMDSEEAVIQMEMLGHSFLLFLDTETDKVCAVYKRHDGNYGLLEPNY